MTEKTLKSLADRGPLAIRTLDALDRAILNGWRVFKSLKFGIFLLALIGVVSIWGTMGFASNAALGDNSIPMARTLVFEHPAFVALLLLFATNLAVSTWHVTRMSFGIYWKKQFHRDPAYYARGRSPRGEVAVEGGDSAVERVLARRFTRLHRDGNAFFAQRGILSRIGPTIVHAGIMIVILATVAKAMLIWNDKIITEGRFVAAEGEEMSFISAPIALEQQISERNRRDIPLDVWVKVHDFDEVKFANSEVPAHFRSLVEVRDPETQEVTFAQLDMNHSLSVPSKKYGRLQFHQAGYQPIPDQGAPRMNYDVRDTVTGERIAVTDAAPGDRVRVGETDMFLEVDGDSPGSRWYVYTTTSPHTAVAEGMLIGGAQMDFSLRAKDFFPDFRIDETTKRPVNASNLPNNPALEVALLMNGRETNTTWLFASQELAEMMPEMHPRFDLELSDIRVAPGSNLETIEWKEPGIAVFDINITDRKTGTAERATLPLGSESKPIVYTSEVGHEGVDLGTENGYEVRTLGPEQRFLTVLSVVNDPTVEYIKLGVGIILLGAMMTFMTRYRAFYGLWDEERGVLRMALVPRWGQSPVREEFDALAAELSAAGTEKAST